MCLKWILYVCHVFNMDIVRVACVLHGYCTCGMCLTCILYVWHVFNMDIVRVACV
jgi:hypothetical protein